MNYTCLLLLNADLFPNTLPIKEGVDGTELSVLRLMDLFEHHGFSSGFMSEVNQQLKSMDEDTFTDLYKSLILGIRLKFTKEWTVFDTQSTNMLDILT